MTVELPLVPLVDNSEGLRRVRARTAGRRRTLNVLFTEADRGGYHVRAWGEGLPEDGGGAFAGRLELHAMDIFALAEELRQIWNNRFLGFMQPSARVTAYPFSEMVDLSSPTLADNLDRVTLDLARAGNKLFRALFYSGDQGLRDLGDAVAEALRTDTQVVSVHSDELFAPWAMLYVPPDPGTNLARANAKWSPDGFVGFRHLIEHNFKRHPGWEPRIAFSGQVRSGVHIDRGLDLQFPDTPTIAPILKIFEVLSQTTVREDRARLADDITTPGFDDQLLYFGCHAVVDSGGRADQQAYVILTDRTPIYTSDFRYWLEQQPLQARPIVFVNACEGGRMSSMFYTSFARVLLQYGASCLIGPQIDVPPAFAAAYASAFLPQILTAGRRVGDVVHELTQDFLTRCGNPLGLAMAVYRGLDSHFDEQTDAYGEHAA